MRKIPTEAIVVTASDVWLCREEGVDFLLARLERGLSVPRCRALVGAIAAMEEILTVGRGSDWYPDGARSIQEIRSSLRKWGRKCMPRADRRAITQFCALPDVEFLLAVIVIHGDYKIVKGLLDQIDSMIRDYIPAVGPIDLQRKHRVR